MYNCLDQSLFFNQNSHIFQIFNIFYQIKNAHTNAISHNLYQIWVDQDFNRICRIADNNYNNKNKTLKLEHLACLFELINDGYVTVFISIEQFLIGVKIRWRNNLIKTELLYPLLQEWQGEISELDNQVEKIILLLVDLIINLENNKDSKTLYLTTFGTIDIIQETIIKESKFLPVTDTSFRRNLFKYRLLIEKLNRLSTIFEHFYKLENYYLTRIQIDYYLTDFKPSNVDKELELELNKIISKEKCKELSDIVFLVRIHLVIPIEQVLEAFYTKAEYELIYANDNITANLDL